VRSKERPPNQRARVSCCLSRFHRTSVYRE
jgi:hypothetical protein